MHFECQRNSKAASEAGALMGRWGAKVRSERASRRTDYGEPCRPMESQGRVLTTGVALSECPFNRVNWEAFWHLHCGGHE